MIIDSTQPVRIAVCCTVERVHDLDILKLDEPPQSNLQQAITTWTLPELLHLLAVVLLRSKAAGGLKLGYMPKHRL